MRLYPSDKPKAGVAAGVMYFNRTEERLYIYKNYTTGWQPVGGGYWTQQSGTNNIYNTNSSGNVGIGTDSPSQKLDVSGTTKATDVCSDSGCLNALYQIVNSVINPELYNHSVTGRHGSECTAIGGNPVYIASGVVICQLPGSSCFTGWTSYSNWSSTSPCVNCAYWCSAARPGLPSVCTYCSTGSHSWSNSVVETCGAGVVTASITQIGCY